MWPWTVQENEFVSEIKKNSDSLINKMKNLTNDLVDVHIDTSTKLFDLRYRDWETDRKSVV